MIWFTECSLFQHHYCVMLLKWAGSAVTWCKWFQVNSLILNLNKTKFIKFSTKLNLSTSICIDYEHNHIENSQVQASWALDRTLSWQLHINKLCACYILRTLKPTLSVNNFKMIYFSYIHCIGIINTRNLHTSAQGNPHAVAHWHFQHCLYTYGVCQPLLTCILDISINNLIFWHSILSFRGERKTACTHMKYTSLYLNPVQ
jgi:hypothetical protein